MDKVSGTLICHLIHCKQSIHKVTYLDHILFHLRNGVGKKSNGSSSVISRLLPENDNLASKPKKFFGIEADFAGANVVSGYLPKCRR